MIEYYNLNFRVKEVFLPQLSWVEPKSIAVTLIVQADCLRRLGEARPSMPPAVNGWVADLLRIAGELADYAESCRQSA